MFKITRYIIIFLIIMMCLFLLKNNNVDSFSQGFISFFNDIKGSSKKDSLDIYNDINSQYNIDKIISTTTRDNVVKSYTEDDIPEKTKKEVKISIDGIIRYTNIEREKVGLKPLIKNINLGRSATDKVDDMFNKQYFEHVSPDKKTVADLVSLNGYKYQIVGENLALGVFDNDKDLVRAWMNSPSHKENILNPKYTDIGVAISIGEYKNQKQWMAVQHFAKPIPLCTEIDTITQDKINIEKTSLELEERELQKMAGIIESDPSQVTIDRIYLNNYNNMVNNYNERLNKLRETIANFNKTILDYNECIKK